MRRMRVLSLTLLGPVALLLIVFLWSCEGTTTVVAVELARVEVSPPNGSVHVGQTLQLSATPKDSEGRLLGGRTFSWSSSNSSVASVNGNGLVFGEGVGTAIISATSERVTGTATVEGTPVPVATVEVSPATASVLVGHTVQLAATAKDAAGNVLTGRAVTWSSDKSSSASVNSQGLVLGEGWGTAIITATSEGVGGTATVTVLIDPGLLVTFGQKTLYSVGPEGNLRPFGDPSPFGSSGVDVLGGRVFVSLLPRYIRELDTSGKVLKEITISSRVPYWLDFVALPSGGFALFDNLNDAVHFVDDMGDLVETVPLPVLDSELQNLGGVLVGDQLFISQLGGKKIGKIDLVTKEASIARDLADFSEGSAWIGSIDYQDGRFFVALPHGVLTFTDDEAPRILVSFGTEQNVVGLVADGPYVYSALNFAQKIYRTSIASGLSYLLSNLSDNATRVQDLASLRR